MNVPKSIYTLYARVYKVSMQEYIKCQRKSIYSLYARVYILFIGDFRMSKNEVNRVRCK